MVLTRLRIVLDDEEGRLEKKEVRLTTFNLRVAIPL
jgi:hypothetical protein